MTDEQNETFDSDDEDDSMEEFQELVDSVGADRERLKRAFADGSLADPQTLAAELVETVMPLIEDLSALAFDNTFYVLRYLDEEVAPVVSGGGAATIPAESMGRVNVLLQMLRNSVIMGAEMAQDDAAKAQAARMLAEVEAAIAETAASLGAEPSPGAAPDNGTPAPDDVAAPAETEPSSTENEQPAASESTPANPAAPEPTAPPPETDSSA